MPESPAGYKKKLKEAQDLLDSSLDVICSLDIEGRFVNVSAASKFIWGYTPEELIGKKCMDLVVEEDQEKTTQAGDFLRTGVNMTNFDNRYRCKDGSIIPIVWSARWDAEQQIMYCVAKDAREKLKTENELRDKKEELLKSVTELKEKNRRLKQLNDSIFLADMIPQIIWMSDSNGNIDYHNKKWEDYTGLNCQQTRDCGWKKVLHPDDAIYSFENWVNSYEKGHHYEVQYRLKRASDGEYRWHLGRAMPMLDEQGNILKWFGTCTDIHDSKLMQEELEKSNADLTSYGNSAKEEVKKKSQFLNGVLKNLPVIVYRLDENGITTDSIGSGLKLIGLNEGQAVGHNALEGYPDLVDKIEQMRKGKSHAYESIIRHNGNDIFFQNYLFPDEINEKAVLGFVLDITEKKKAEMILNKAKLQAENANQFKTRFLASMSHEIRTPLNAILGFARILKSADISASQSLEYLDFIESSGSLLLKLIGDILDLSKIEAGKLTIHEEQFSFKETIHESINPYKFKANENGLDFEVNICSHIPDRLISDSYRINQIVINLIGNALKFTREGKIAVGFKIAEIKPMDPELIFLEISVQDTGIGISSENQTLIFDSFTQADDSIVKEFGGSGLGLSITSQLVTLMGGSIKVESPINHNVSVGGPGAMFRVRLPLKIDKSNITEKERHINHQPSFVFTKNINILVAEDNELNQRLASFMLKKMGCSADIANNGMEALELLKKNSYDLVLMDVQMPIMDGFTTTKIIRGELNSVIPIIGLTANVFREDIEDCLNAGMTDHLGKPYNLEQLYSVIEKWREW